ncbi:hypothetical protein DPMN_040634 [Dreissena polymorpha]|uniref:Uncharacterized protein n=1 Tax=Dreissena polymorpha TaxID=45954 RepID=A0A9D4CY26_DREPO|nr:hypothetical protein DPMN_040634 [Dreissena polymorpha]
MATNKKNILTMVEFLTMVEPTDSQTDRQTDTQSANHKSPPMKLKSVTDRLTDRQTDTQSANHKSPPVKPVGDKNAIHNDNPMMYTDNPYPWCCKALEHLLAYNPF